MSENKKKEFWNEMVEVIGKGCKGVLKKEEKSIYVGFYSKSGEKVVAVNKSKKFRLFFNNVGIDSMDEFVKVDGFRKVSKDERKKNKYGSTDYIYEGVSEVKIEEFIKKVVELKNK